MSPAQPSAVVAGSGGHAGAGHKNNGKGPAAVSIGVEGPAGTGDSGIDPVSSHGVSSVLELVDRVLRRAEQKGYTLQESEVNVVVQRLRKQLKL
jgi:hypothetical protein